jgi:hypothetical protein
VIRLSRSLIQRPAHETHCAVNHGTCHLSAGNPRRFLVQPRVLAGPALAEQEGGRSSALDPSFLSMVKDTWQEVPIQDLASDYFSQELADIAYK